MIVSKGKILYIMYQTQLFHSENVMNTDVEKVQFGTPADLCVKGWGEGYPAEIDMVTM